MNPERQREKTYHAMTFFLSHTRDCYKKKLFKLLFLLDFDFFELAGRPVTHLDYFAWKMGPVPTELQEGIESNEGDLSDHFAISTEHLGPGVDAVVLESREAFDARFFSPAELELMERLADTWRDATAKDLEDFTHREGTPWYRVWEVENKRQQIIPFDYALDYLEEGDREGVRKIAHERAAFIKNYQHA